MSKIDSRLKFLQQESRATLEELEATGRFAVRSAEVMEPEVTVLVQFTGNLADLEAQGFRPRTIAGDVATGTVTLSQIDAIAALPNVIKVESSRPLAQDLDVSLADIRANLAHTGPPGYRGAGVIVGIIDSGIDFTHQSLRAADGTSRIRFLWDQMLAPTGGESNPTGFSYGVEYTKANIDAALASTNPSSVVRHRDTDTSSGHGTHVAGIAAGDGSIAGNGQPAFTFVGVAPEADIIVVANRVTTQALGDSASTLDAVSYIFTTAASLGKPVVINMSQGDNIGPHDGTSLLERGIDNLLGGPGRAMVKSAGNEGASERHASGTIVAGGIQTVQFVVDPGDTTPDTFDIWYLGSDRFNFSVTPPAGVASAVITPGTTTTIALPNGNRVFVDSVLNDPNNTDNRIYVQLSRGTSPTIRQGTWSFTLQGVMVVNGRFDAWIERGPLSVVPSFIPPHLDPSFTLSIPGTSQKLIAVASYITKGPGVGNISSFSSRGPTRDGRPKPEIAAPGQSIMSARAAAILSGSDQYHQLAGTSMAAPHVAGLIALMLQKDRNLTQDRIKNHLTAAARADAFTGTVPNNTWGAGKLDAKASVDRVSIIKLKVRDDPITLKFLDDPITFKFRDDPITLKFRDDLLTFKFRDDVATNPVIDPVKRPGLDKPPAGDHPGGPALAQPSEAAPFVLSTPHHSMAWSQSYPEAHRARLAEYESAIAQYEQRLGELNQAYAQGQLNQAELQQVETLYQEYQALLAEYRQLSQQG